MQREQARSTSLPRVAEWLAEEMLAMIPQAQAGQTSKTPEVLNILTLNGRKASPPDLQINKGQLDRIINGVYYQVIVQDHFTCIELNAYQK